MAHTDRLSRIRSVVEDPSDDHKVLEKLLEENPPLDINSVHFLGTLPQAYGIDYPDRNLTLLHLACTKKKPNTAAFLLERKLLQIPTEISRLTPLHCAIGDDSDIRSDDVHRHITIIECLLNNITEPEKRKKYIDTQDYRGMTALHCAIKSRSQLSVQLLIRDGPPDMFKLDQFGRTPLESALLTERCDLVEELLKVDQERQLSMVNYAGETCLHIATKTGNQEITRLLLNKMNLEMIRRKDRNGDTAWDLAANCPISNRVLRPTPIYVFMEREYKEYLLEVSANRVQGSGLGVTSRQFLRLPPPGMFGQFGQVGIRDEIRFLNNRSNMLMLLLYFEQPEQIFNWFLHDFLNDHDCSDQDDENNFLIKYREPTCLFDHGTEYVSLVMPYFVLRTEAQIQPWRDGTRRSSFSREIKKGWECIVSDRPESYGVYLPLTLDEYCCPALPWEILKVRNSDQVLLRTSTTGRTKKAASTTPKMITINQVWLWRLKDIVFGTPHEEVAEGTGYGGLSSDPLRRMGLIIARLLDYLDAPSKDESILNIFQKAITLVSENVNQYLKDIAMDNINSKLEKRFIHDISDIREELSMIKRVLLQQEEVWKEFSLTAWPDFWPYGPEGRMVVPKETMDKAEEAEKDEWRRIVRIPAQFKKYHRRIEALDEDATRVEQGIGAKLDLMAKHATIRESHASAILSAGVFGFTVITVIFTPLSFFTSLFALPIDRFQANQIYGRFSNETGMYTTNYIGKFVATGEIVSVAVTLFAMWLAVRFGMGVHVFRTLWEWLKEHSSFLRSISEHGSKIVEALQSAKNSLRKPNEPKKPKPTVTIPVDNIPWSIEKNIRSPVTDRSQATPDRNGDEANASTPSIQSAEGNTRPTLNKNSDETNTETGPIQTAKASSPPTPGKNGDIDLERQ